MTRLESGVLCLTLSIIINYIWATKCKRDLRRIRTKNQSDRDMLTHKILSRYEIGIVILVFLLMISLMIIDLL